MERDEEALGGVVDDVNRLAKGFDDAYEKVRPYILSNLQAQGVWGRATNVYGLYVNTTTPWGASLTVVYPEPSPKIVLEV